MESGRRSRVVFVASTLVTGGAERVVETLAAGLAGRGFDAAVLCLRAAGEIGERVARSGVPVRTGLARFRRDPLAPLRLAAALREIHPDALVSLDHHDAIFASALAAAAAGPRRRVLMVHSTGLWGKRGSFSRVDRAALPAFGSVVALARSHAAYLVEREGIARDRVVVIPNGVDTERFRPASAAERAARRRELGVPAGAFAAGIVAALRPEKNHELFLRAAARTAAALPDARFLVVGEGGEAGTLQALAGTLGLGERVLFLGRRDDVPAVLAALDVLVLPSHPVVETFPLVVLEGMASGLAVVAADVGSIREMLVDGEEGFIVPSGDEGALADRLAALAGDAARRERAGAAGRRRVVRDFTVDAMIASYAELLSGAPARRES